MLVKAQNFFIIRKWGIALAVLAFVIDILTKQAALKAEPFREVFIPGLVEWTLSFNRGVSFNFLGNIDGTMGDLMPYKLSALAIVASIFFLWWMGQKGSIYLQLGLGLMMGGALGNMVDRLNYGAVIDFVSLRFGEHPFFICNGADIFISAGVGCILLDGFIEWRDKRRGITT
jgi:signal peptidase II